VFCSVVMPLYNSVNVLGDAIESVRAQTFEEWELIVVDDCSTDGSYEMARSFAREDNRINVVRNNQNRGPALTRNKAIEMAKGRYLAFLDADDLWLKDKLAAQLKFMQDNDYLQSTA